MLDLARRAVAEGLGTAFLVTAVVGSGIMATRLTQDVAIALLANSLATGAALVVLVTILGPLSGAHLNPAVSLVFALRRELPPLEAGLYVAAQVSGGLVGTLATHAMYGLPLVTFTSQTRFGQGQWLAEGIATFGLVSTILVGVRINRVAVPCLVGLYITSAYWFTSSTSFANPGVTVARAITETFAGIHPYDVPAFVAAQLSGAIGAWLLLRRMA